MSARKSQQRNNIRLIAGQWRGRTLSFPDAEGLRPTPDRVRETAFNWLQASIPGASCIDCFAGSGALGFEAASRGAKSVCLLDNNPEVVQQLQANQRLLDASSVEVVLSSSLDYLTQKKPEADIFFLDPPFSSTLLQPLLDLIIEASLLNPGGRLYLEYAKDNPPSLPDGCAWHRQKEAGDVGYAVVIKT